MSDSHVAMMEAEAVDDEILANTQEWIDVWNLKLHSTVDPPTMYAIPVTHMAI